MEVDERGNARLAYEIATDADPRFFSPASAKVS